MIEAICVSAEAGSWYDPQPRQVVAHRNPVRHERWHAAMAARHIHPKGWRGLGMCFLHHRYFVGSGHRHGQGSPGSVLL